MVKDEIHKQMGFSNPCYYNDYFDFERYKRDMIHSSVNVVAGDLGIDEKVLSTFKGELWNDLNSMIKKYYNKFLKENCRPRW